MPTDPVTPSTRAPDLPEVLDAANQMVTSARWTSGITRNAPSDSSPGIGPVPYRGITAMNEPLLIELSDQFGHPAAMRLAHVHQFQQDV